MSFLTRYSLGVMLLLFGAVLGCLCAILAGRPEARKVEHERDVAKRNQRTLEAENGHLRQRLVRVERNGEG